MSLLNRKRTDTLMIPWRFYVVLCFAALLFTLLAIRAAYIQIISPEKLRQQQDARTLRLIAHKNQRGLILDRHGEVLAASVPLRAIWVDPKHIIPAQSLDDHQRWQALADILEQDKTTLLQRLENHKNRRFLYLKRQVTPAVADYIASLKLTGVHSKPESKRFYPGGESIAQLIGVTNVDDRSLSK